jgi:8-oxo-dGTP diphosphatase
MTFVDPKIYYQNLPKKRMGAGVLFLNESGELLIVKPNYKEYWLIPGGTTDANESPRQGCIREIKEELGLEIKQLEFLCVDYTSANNDKSESLQFIFNGGVLSLKQIAQIKIEVAELDGYKFVKFKEALKLFSPWLKNRLLKCQEAMNKNKALYLDNGK